MFTQLLKLPDYLIAFPKRLNTCLFRKRVQAAGNDTSSRLTPLPVRLSEASRI